MMKKFFFAALCAASFALTGCDKETEGVTGVTYYASYTYADENNVVLGSEFDPGFTALCKGKDVTDEVSYVITDLAGNEVDEVATDAPAVFHITYSYVNGDNKCYPVVRTIYVFDPTVTTSLEGTFELDAEHSRFYAVSEKGEVTDQTYAERSKAEGTKPEVTVTMKELVPGFFQVDDLFAGWYSIIRDYSAKYEGYDFRAGGYISLSADNKVGLVSSSVPAFGDALTLIKSAVYDPETKTLSYVAVYAGMEFTVVLKKKN